MRITLGGIILFCGAAGIVYFGARHIDGLGSVGRSIQKVQDRAASFFGFSHESELFNPADPAAPTNADTTPLAGPLEEEPGPPDEAERPELLPVKSPTSPIPKNLVPKNPVRTKPRPKRKPTVKKTSQAPPVPAASPKKTVPPKSPEPPSRPSPSLVGSYVTLELANGRQIKGVLEGKSDAEYRLELPGLGTFKYPVGEVKNVSLAE